LTLPVETLKSVPPGKAVWNANGGFVSVLLTHLLFFILVFTFILLYCLFIVLSYDVIFAVVYCLLSGSLFSMLL